MPIHENRRNWRGARRGMGRTSKDKRDIYYRLAKEEGWRARSAYKLLQLDAQFGLLAGARRVVDLCAAPGSWSQVLARAMSTVQTAPDSVEPAHIVAVDLQQMAPIDGVVQLRGDITRAETAAAIVEAMGGGLAHLVVCDGAPDVTGMHDMDEYVQGQLLLSALAIAMRVLLPGGAFVAKVFRGPDSASLLSHVRLFFSDVVVAKPASSRASSLEAFVVARGFSPPAGFEPKVLMAYVARQLSWDAPPDAEARRLVPFVACGDLSGYDSETTHALPEGHSSLPPVQPPISAPYCDALAERRRVCP